MAKKAEVKTSKKKAKPAPKVTLLDGNFNVCCRFTVRANKPSVISVAYNNRYVDVCTRANGQMMLLSYAVKCRAAACSRRLSSMVKLAGTCCPRLLLSLKTCTWVLPVHGRQHGVQNGPCQLRWVHVCAA